MPNRSIVNTFSTFKSFLIFSIKRYLLRSVWARQSLSSVALVWIPDDAFWIIFFSKPKYTNDPPLQSTMLMDLGVSSYVRESKGRFGKRGFKMCNMLVVALLGMLNCLAQNTNLSSIDELLWVNNVSPSKFSTLSFEWLLQSWNDYLNYCAHYFYRHCHYNH